MKIEKVKIGGRPIYPTTIAAAIKDANFRKSGNAPMTQGEINSKFNTEIKGLSSDLSSAHINDKGHLILGNT